MKIGRLSLIDPGTPEARQDKIGVEVERMISTIFLEPSRFVPALVPNDRKQIRAALIRLCDDEKCPLVLTFGGSGPGPEDIVPDVTLEVVDRKLPGFGEIMRYYSYERFKVSVLSRAEAGVRGRSLIINLPARPKPVKFCLRLLQEGIAEALEQIAGIKPGLRGDEIEVPIDKYLPFLKRLRPKPDPGGEKHP
ncbi:MAG: MogA/MoaB family molybdenum cofactor biosynthesis protein, partial [Methylacidiphilales bacterium]|nr:MogA/MoaB family molybdenum cofactor biosynthesis protein [Candidatus Methylacidiphilales bacterium]